jgi:hypothetical protein
VFVALREIIGKSCGPFAITPSIGLYFESIPPPIRISDLFAADAHPEDVALAANLISLNLQRESVRDDDNPSADSAGCMVTYSEPS